jgi:hypothetical protein
VANTLNGSTESTIYFGNNADLLILDSDLAELVFAETVFFSRSYDVSLVEMAPEL